MVSALLDHGEDSKYCARFIFGICRAGSKCLGWKMLVPAQEKVPYQFDILSPFLLDHPLFLAWFGARLLASSLKLRFRFHSKGMCLQIKILYYGFCIFCGAKLLDFHVKWPRSKITWLKLLYEFQESNENAPTYINNMCYHDDISTKILSSRYGYIAHRRPTLQEACA